MLNIDATELTAEEVIELITLFEGSVSVQTREWIYMVYAQEEE